MNVKIQFKDALIIAFDGDKKISISEAKNKESQSNIQISPKEEILKSNIVFRIQVFSSRNKVPKDNYDMRRIQKYTPINFFTENGWYKYTCTESTSYEKAKENLKIIKEIFKDAVIIAFDGDKKISIQEAIKK